MKKHLVFLKNKNFLVKKKEINKLILKYLTRNSIVPTKFKQDLFVKFENINKVHNTSKLVGFCQLTGKSSKGVLNYFKLSRLVVKFFISMSWLVGFFKK